MLIIGLVLNLSCFFILFSFFVIVLDLENKKWNVYLIRLYFGVLEVSGFIFNCFVCFMRYGFSVSFFLVKYYIVVIFLIG